MGTELRNIYCPQCNDWEVCSLQRIIEDDPDSELGWTCLECGYVIEYENGDKT
jgi:RNase P subunit RPR2